MEKIKAFQVRLPRDLWVFIKHESIRREESMNEIIVDTLEKSRRKIQKMVDNMIS